MTWAGAEMRELESMVEDRVRRTDLCQFYGASASKGVLLRGERGAFCMIACVDQCSFVCSPARLRQCEPVSDSAQLPTCAGQPCTAAAQAPLQLRQAVLPSVVLLTRQVLSGQRDRSLHGGVHEHSEFSLIFSTCMHTTSQAAAWS